MRRNQVGEVNPDTLAAIKQQTGCRIIYASGVSPIVFSHPIERQGAHLYDLVLVNDYYHGIQWMELGARRMECLPIAAIDPDFHYPQPLSEAEKAAYAFNVTFVGMLIPANFFSDRVLALEAEASVQHGARHEARGRVAAGRAGLAEDGESGRCRAKTGCSKRSRSNPTPQPVGDAGARCNACGQRQVREACADGGVAEHLLEVQGQQEERRGQRRAEQELQRVGDEVRATAEERGFQETDNLPIIQGRLAEMVGERQRGNRKETAVDHDRKMRTFGWARAARRTE